MKLETHPAPISPAAAELVARAWRANASALAAMRDPDARQVWCVVDTLRDGDELVAQRRIRDLGYPAYCLLEPFWVVSGRRGRTRRAHARPRIPRMLFVRADRAGLRALLRRGIVTSADNRPGHVLLVPADALLAFVTRHDTRLTDAREHVQRIAVGERITIAVGPYAGHAARVTSATRRTVGVSLPIFGRETAAKIPVDAVRRVA